MTERSDGTIERRRPPGGLPPVRQRDREATSRRLLEAARDLFAEHGYEQVTVRMIAAAAGVNVALIGRYFGSKAALFGEVIARESMLDQVIEGNADGLPRRLAEYLLSRSRADSDSPLLRMLDRSVGCPETRPVLRAKLMEALVHPLAQRLDGPDPYARAMLVAAVVLGTGPLGRLLGADALAASDPDAMLDRVTKVLTLCLATHP